MAKLVVERLGLRLLKGLSPIADKLSNTLLNCSVILGKRFSRRRMKKGTLRSLWGATPILTLPLLARCDQLLGIESNSLVFSTYVVTHNFDINLNRPQNWIIKNIPALYLPFLNIILAWALLRYDIFHFFCDRGILAPVDRMGINPKELALLNRAGKLLFTYTYGADVRTQETTKALGHYNLCMSCPAPGVSCICDEQTGKANIEQIREHATAMNAMGDMLAYVPGSRNMHYWPIDLEKIAYVGVRKDWGKPLRIAHVPNHTHFKGTSYLDDAVQRLRDEGHEIELLRAQAVPNERVLEIYAQADLVADQFIAGFHGYAALEAMSLGKPVLCYLRNTDMMLAPESCPIINVNPDSLYDILKQILTGGMDLIEIGLCSRHYVEAHYSMYAVASRLGDMYLEFAEPSERMQKEWATEISACKAKIPSIFIDKLMIDHTVQRYQIDRKLAMQIAAFGDLGEFAPMIQAPPISLAQDCDRNLIVMLVVSALRIDPRVEREARALAKQGYRVIVICPDLSHPPLRESPIDWGRNIEFDILGWEAANYVNVSPWLLGDLMLQAALAYKPLAFHCHDLNTALIGLAASRKTGAKCVCDFHEWYSENVSWNVEKKKWLVHPRDKRFAYQSAEALVMAQADEVITVCDSIANELMARYPERQQKTEVIRNIPPLSISDTKYPSLRQELAIADGKLILLWQGGTGPTRLLEPVIESLAYAKNVVLVIRGPSLDLFGKGYLKLAKKVGVAKRLHLLPPVKSADVVTAALGADIGVWTLPNLCKNFYYALPNKLFEYLAAGLPIVCADFPEARAIIKRYKVGAVFEPYDPKSIALALLKLTDTSFREACRQNTATALVDLKANEEWDKLANLYHRLQVQE